MSSNLVTETIGRCDTQPAAGAVTMITFSRKGFRIGEQYFWEAAPSPRPAVDLVRTIAVLSPAGDRKGWRQGNSVIIDLRQDEETLLAQMDKGTRYEVRRALTKDNLTIEQRDTFREQELTVFCDYYDTFAQNKALRPIFRPRVTELARQGMLVLSNAYDENGVLLVQHAYVRSGTYAILLHSASHFRLSSETSLRNLIGRANRCLHWQDMCFFRARGVEAYDMGGIDVTGRTPETTLIAEFKRGFGGTIVTNYSKTTACSLKGMLAAQMIAWLKIPF